MLSLVANVNTDGLSDISLPKFAENEIYTYGTTFQISNYIEIKNRNNECGRVRASDVFPGSPKMLSYV